MGSYIIIEKDKETISLINQTISERFSLLYYGVENSEESSLKLMLTKLPLLVFFNLDIIRDFKSFISDLSQYVDELPYFVAISRDKRFAFDAINSSINYYLLTPVDEVELIKALSKFNKLHDEDIKKNICLKSYKDFHYINPDEIMYLKADNNSTEFYLENGVIINAFKTLKIFENSLPDSFYRIHKSYIINSRHISRINFGKLQCVLKNKNCKIPFTNTYIESVFQINNMFTRNSILTFN